MGGYGSGRWHGSTTKTTVEACLVLSADRRTRDRSIRAGAHIAGHVTWRSRRTGKGTASIGFEANTAASPPWLRLHYTRKQTGEAVDYELPLTRTTTTPWGAARWWFVCPLIADGRPCARRVGKLYLPPGGRYFGCRHCHDLTYTSCNESRKYDSLYRTPAADPGWPPARVKRMMKEEEW